MRRPVLFLILLAALLVSCTPQPVRPVPVEPIQPPTTAAGGEVVVTMIPATLPAATMPAETLPAATQQPEATLPAATEPPAVFQQSWVAYIGEEDGNIWLVHPGSGETRQVTLDGTPMGGPMGGEIVTYETPQWSPDGTMLAFQRQLGQPVESGYQFDFSLMVYDLESGAQRTLLSGMQTAGFAWQPGTRQIAFGQPTAHEYFATRGAPDAAYARGILTINVDTGERAELVRPERGLSLVQPNFSPDGKKVAFQEVYMMEGAGYFAYYDLEAQQYHSWEKPVGPFSWSPDSQRLTYAYLTYTPSGEESIYTNTLQGDAEKRLLPDDGPDSYAFAPVFSPDGSQIAFITDQVVDRLPAGTVSKGQVMVMPVDGGEPQALAVFEQPGDLQWSADGQSLLLSYGPWFNGRQVELLSLDGTSKQLGLGSFASFQPLP